MVTTNKSKQDYLDNLKTLDDKQKVKLFTQNYSLLSVCEFDYNIIKAHLYLDLLKPIQQYLDNKISKDDFVKQINKTSEYISNTPDMFDNSYYTDSEKTIFVKNNSKQPKEIVNTLLTDYFYDEIKKRFESLEFCVCAYSNISHYLSYKYCNNQQYKRFSARFEKDEGLIDLDERSSLLKIFHQYIFLTTD